MDWVWKLKSRSHNRSCYLIEVVTKAGLTVLFKSSQTCFSDHLYSNNGCGHWLSLQWQCYQREPMASTIIYISNSTKTTFGSLLSITTFGSLLSITTFGSLLSITTLDSLLSYNKIRFFVVLPIRFSCNLSTVISHDREFVMDSFLIVKFLSFFQFNFSRTLSSA